MSEDRKPFVKPSKLGSGMMFKNFRKKQPNHPDGTGSCEIDGKKYEISAWIKPLKNGKGTFYSLSFTEPRERGNASGLPSAETPASEPAPHATEHPTTEPQENFVV